MISRIAASLLLLFGICVTVKAPAALTCGELFSTAAPKPAQVFETKGGKKIAYSTSGNKDAETLVVFLNGIDKNFAEWNAVRDDLAAKKSDLQFLQWDMEGQGQTAELNHSSLRISAKGQIHLLETLLQDPQFRGKKLILIGHSYGGGIAAGYAHTHQNAVSKAILIAPYVDHLETYEPEIGPWLTWVKMYSQWTGLNNLYEQNLQVSSTLGILSSWPMYTMLGRSKARVSDVIALTLGSADLHMSDSVSDAGNTQFSLIVSGLDELIPTSAHRDLYQQIPRGHRGLFRRLPTSHESVSLSPSLVTSAILEAIGLRG